MTNIEAMKLALDALEGITETESISFAKSYANDVIPELRQAISEAEQADMNLNCKSVQKRLATSWGYVKTEQSAASEARHSEPVAELTDDEIYDAAYATFCRGPNTRELFRMMWTCNPPCSIGWDRNELKAFARHIASLYTAPPKAEQEPVDVIKECIRIAHMYNNSGEGGIIANEIEKLYTAPPQREWVGLTDEERADCWRSSAVQSALNIAAKLKEKNK